VAGHQCDCSLCRRDTLHRHRELHCRIRLLTSIAPPSTRKIVAAALSEWLPQRQHRLLTEITGLAQCAIRQGHTWFDLLLAGKSLREIRGKPGRKPIEETYPDIERIIEGVLVDDTAGDPMSNAKWPRASSRKLSRKLAAMGYTVNYHTVCRLLHKFGYSLKMNLKQRAASAGSPRRDAQFVYIGHQRAAFLAAGDPVVSVDCKKKELVGHFRASGRSWSKQAIQVDEGTFASLAKCVAAPYGVYDIARNEGFVCVGISRDTPAFAVGAIRRWWLSLGCGTYPTSDKLLILCDGGGSNGWRNRAWKSNLQMSLCDELGLTVSVCHFPPRCSKYNPIERRLFSHISMNWLGRPLTSLQTMLAYIRGTTTQAGLVVHSCSDDADYRAGERVSRRVMEGLRIQPHGTLPDWNYTISPRSYCQPASPHLGLSGVAPRAIGAGGRAG